MTSPSVVIDLLARDRASAVLDKVGNKAEKTGKKFGGLGAAAKAGIAGLVGGSIAAASVKVFDMAANMELMDAKAKTVFGDQIGVVQKWAKANAAGMGLTSREATTLSANFADLLIPMGFTRDSAAKMSTKVVGLSGALSRWSGGTKSAAEVSAILAKAMLGERDGLKELGISISDADVKARLLKNGKDKLTGAALQQATALATEQLIMEKSTDAQTAYAKGADTLAAKKAKATAKLKEFRDNGIAKLIPLLTKSADFIDRNSAVLKPLGLILGVVTVGVITVTAATAAWNAVMLMNPIGLVVIALAALAAGLFYAYQKSETFRKIVDGAFKAISTAASFMWNNVLKPVFRLWLNTWFTVIGALVNGAASAFGWVPGIGGKLKAAAKQFNAFRDDVNRSLDGIRKSTTVDVKIKTNFFSSRDASGVNMGLRAAGGPLTRDATLVGEGGVEILDRGRIYNNRQTRSMLRGNGGGDVYHIDARGAQAGVAQEIVRVLKQYKRETGTNLGLA